ncbi:uncharacterized protein LOC132555598 [Ylistrum balloti]|uniref:uncharacterized protein LOC132555598 n=1 Tax=Ylistrum balloti TaxID=509963 RepID=UPI002905B800|nr:uncharacterized protein LOC132555598 [Ylistrum balloti]
MDSDQLEKIKDVFAEMGVTPKCDSAEEFKNWMLDYMSSTGAISKSGKDVKPKEPIAGGPSKQHVFTQPPRLPFFSGDPTSKGEVPYELWKYDADCLLRDETIPKETALRVIRSSLRGNAGMIAMRLGPKASVGDLLAHLETNYGVVDDHEALLGKFFSAHQQEGEDVASWGCRLEDLLMKVSRCEMLSQSKRNDMLHSRIWKGLLPKLKERSATKYELTKDYNELKVELRKLESEMKMEGTGASAKSATTKMIDASVTEDSRLDKLEGKIKQLSADVKSWKSSAHQQKKPHKSQEYQQYQQPTKKREHKERGDTLNRSDTDDSSNEPQCWRCGQYGHIQLGCKVRLDHQRRGQFNNRGRHLNGKGPVGRGRP